MRYMHEACFIKDFGCVRKLKQGTRQMQNISGDI